MTTLESRLEGKVRKQKYYINPGTFSIIGIIIGVGILASGIYKMEMALSVAETLAEISVLHGLNATFYMASIGAIVIGVFMDFIAWIVQKNVLGEDKKVKER